MLGEANNFSSEINQTQFPALTELNLIEIRTIIANSQASLNAELSTFEPQNISENDKTLLRIGQPDVNYAFTDTLEQSGINHINIDTISLENPRSALTEIYQTGDNLLREQGLPSPNIEFYHKAAKQAQESDQNIQDVLTEMRNSHPLMMRADLDPPETIRSLPEGEFTQAQVQNFTLGQAAENNNTSGLQTSAVGDFKGDTNYCSRSAPDINLKNHGPNGKLVHATDDLISIYPRAGSVPHATIPNTVGADGFSTWALNDHVYNVYTDTRGMGLTPDAVGQAFRDNPTPGDDNKATPDGTRNNVGPIERPVIWDNAYQGGNWVNSFNVPSPDPERFTDITVNYTRSGEHLLHEGYVMRYGAVEDGEVVGLRSYGEGHAWEQSEQLSGIWCEEAQKLWNDNHQEIIEEVSAGID